MYENKHNILVTENSNDELITERPTIYCLLNLKWKSYCPGKVVYQVSLCMEDIKLNYKSPTEILLLRET